MLIDFIPQRAKAVRLPRGYYGVGVRQGRHVYQRVVIGRIECGLQGAYQNPDVNRRNAICIELLSGTFTIDLKDTQNE
jgi:hypothetical protein